METSYPIPASSQATSVSQSTAVKKPKFEFNLEALRGFAAIIVAVFHSLFIDASLDPTFSPQNKLADTLPGRSCVLIFFILSGYVIGLTNTKSLTLATIKPYLRKRFIRLYPIYAISLCVTLLAAIQHYQITTVIGNFLFLQNSVVPIIHENYPLWSLNNEVIYYLLFIPFCLLKLKPGQVCLASFGLGIFFYAVLRQPLLCSYSTGFAFWTSGLWLAQSNFFVRQYASRIELIALLLIFLGYEALNPFATAILVIFEKLHIPLIRHTGFAVQVEDIGRFVFLFYIFLRFTNLTIKGATLFIYLTIGSGFAYYIYSIIKYKGITSHQGLDLLIPVLFLLAGLLVLIIAYRRPSLEHASQFPPIFIKLGAVSYGIYVIHYPISILLSHIPFFSGTALTFCIRLAIDLTLVVSAAYLLELKFQPWFKRKFDLAFN